MSNWKELIKKSNFPDAFKEIILDGIVAHLEIDDEHKVQRANIVVGDSNEEEFNKYEPYGNSNGWVLIIKKYKRGNK